MAVNPIPEGYQSVVPYLIAPGNAAELIDFAKVVFGAEEKERHPTPEGGVGHAEIKIGDSIVMLADAGGEWKPSTTPLFMYSDDCDGVYQRAMDAGAESVKEATDEFYGDRVAGFKDPAGNTWWISTHIEDVSDEEIARRMKEAAQQS